MSHIHQSQFKARFIALVLGGGGLPKKTEDRQILYLSAVLALEPGREYSEPELNEALKPWCARYGEGFGLDHVTLRRYLIDEGYLLRDPAGSAYRLNTEQPPYTYDEAVAGIDLDGLIDAARQEREERKRRYMNSTSS